MALWLGIGSLCLLLVFLGIVSRFWRQPSLRKLRSELDKRLGGEAVAEIDQFLASIGAEGWSAEAVYQVCWQEVRQTDSHHWADFMEHLPSQARQFGSPIFYRLLRAESSAISPKRAYQFLSQILVWLDLPEQWTADELATLEGRMDRELPPHHPFWSLFASLVSRAFPQDSLAEDGQLGRKVHQLRYLISYQQASWVRRHFGQNLSDWQALAAYLATLPRWTYQLGQSARLHNKQRFGKENLQALPVNSKVLIGFHSEFILSQEGDFVLILAEKSSRNGLVNGASFNYAKANNQRHRQLDVAPVGPHDPAYRRQALRSKAGVYLSPTRNRQFWKSSVAWQQSYFNSRGAFSLGGNSRARQVKEQGRRFARDIRRFRSSHQANSWYNKG